MTKQPYQHGEIVDITIRGARVTSWGRGGLFLDLPGDARGMSLPTTDDGKPTEGVQIVVTCPADGPAQLGDVWRDKTGVRWFAFEKPWSNGRGVDVMLTNGHSEDVLAWLCQNLGPLTLVHRELPVFALGELDGIRNDAAALMADATAQLRASTDGPSFLAGVNALMDASQAAADAEEQVA